MRALLLLLALTGCAVPPIDDLRSATPREQFTVDRPLPCLFAVAVEHVSGYSGMTEPTFTYSPGISGDRTAWMRQPLTLVEFEARTPTTTEVRLSQTPGARAMGQGGDLVRFLRSAPACPA